MAARNKTYIKFFKHFAERLGERYGIFITFEEYCKLCNTPYIKNHKKYSEWAISGTIEINKVKVKVLRATTQDKCFLTALPKNAKISKHDNNKQNNL